MTPRPIAASLVGALVGALAGAALLAGLAAGPVRADDPAATLYEASILDYWGGRYAKSTRRILDEGFAPELTPAEFGTLLQTTLSFPARGQGLMGFYAAWPPPEIVLPVVSLKLLDDLSIAYAWLWAEGHGLDTIETYIAMLRYKPRESFPGRRYPTPFQALGVPEDALEDPAVDGLSLRLFNSARAFILAHELAHLHLEHAGGDTLRQEIEADAFAIDLLARTGTIPMGMVLYFQAMAHWSPNRAQFGSDAAWRAFLAEHRTHPVTAERIEAIAAGLNRQAAAFARHDPNPDAAVDAVRFIADNLSTLVDYLRDEDMQRCVGETAYEAKLADLAPHPAGSERLGCAD